ncbi:MAG: 1,4-dihydroxy-2-naphthoate octaprenyltransferase [Chloroflexia bacterium]
MTRTHASVVATWLRGMRAPFFTASIVPVLVGGAAAVYTAGSLDWGKFLLTFLGMVALHAAANIWNDYLDYQSGCDPNNPARTVFNGGSNVIAEGLLSERAMRRAALLAYILGGGCGLALAVLMGRPGWVVLLLGAVGVAIGYTYTARPIFLAGRGLGELGVGLSFGLLAVSGTYFVQTGYFSCSSLLASLPVSGLIVAVLWINQFPDVPADHAVGKDNLVVRLGPARARYGYDALLGLTYGSVALGSALGVLPLWTLLALATLPLSLRSARILHRHYQEGAALLPAQAGTIQTHLLTGLLLALGLLLGRVV